MSVSLPAQRPAIEHLRLAPVVTHSLGRLQRRLSELPVASTFAAVFSVAVFSFAALSMLLLVGPARSLGQESPASSTTEKVDDRVELKLGFNDLWKLGHACPARITLAEDLASRGVSKIEMDTVDGDGVAVTYRQNYANPTTDEAITTADPQVSYWMTVRIGRADTDVTVRAFDAAGSLLARRVFFADALPTALSSNQPFVLAVGSSMGLEELSRRDAGGRGDSLSVATVNDAFEFPTRWEDYTSCDLLVISCQDAELIQSISPAVWNAMEVWIKRGGGGIISLGTDQVESDGLQSLLPGNIEGVAQVNDPGVLESLVATDQPLDGFTVSRLEAPRGTIELSLTDTFSRDVPWWISYPLGAGTMRAIATDLDHPSFSQWRDRRILWERLLAPYFDRALFEGVSDESQARESSYLGYDDLVGQLRATLDVFSQLQRVSFAQVAALLLGILVLIGPLDYLISVKWLNRPQFSWYFVGAMLLAICVGLSVLYTSIRPDEVRINTVQTIDIDAKTGATSGQLWCHVYSGAAREVDIEAKDLVSASPIFLDWQGLPGNGLGGLDSQLNTDRGMPAYSIDIEPSGKSSIQAVGIPTAGTKCLTAGWQGTMELSSQSTLVEISGVDQLTGQLVNPLDVDLKEPVLFYHNWFYQLNSRIPPGGSVEISFDTIPKDLARRLNQQRTVEGNDSIARWNPAARDSVDRLLELMMFHKAAAGKTYTSLANRYQPHVDHSNLLETDNAILIGRLDAPLAAINVVDSRDKPVEVKQDMNRVWCRLIIPVASDPKSN